MRANVTMTSMKAWFLIALCIVSMSTLAAEPPPSLTHRRCYICHADHDTLVGPSFADVALRYRGKRTAVTDISNQIRAGIRGGGPWHMPPHPEVSPDEARAMARYIMTVKPQAEAREVKQAR